MTEANYKVFGSCNLHYDVTNFLTQIGKDNLITLTTETYSSVGYGDAGKETLKHKIVVWYWEEDE